MDDSVKQKRRGKSLLQLSISLRGLPKEFIETLQKENCNISSVVNRAIVEALKNPAFLQSVLNDEIDSKERADAVMKQVGERVGIPSKKMGAKGALQHSPFGAQA